MHRDYSIVKTGIARAFDVLRSHGLIAMMDAPCDYDKRLIDTRAKGVVYYTHSDEIENMLVRGFCFVYFSFVLSW